MTCRGGLGSQKVQEKTHQSCKDMEPDWSLELLEKEFTGKEDLRKTKPLRMKQDWLLEESGQRGAQVGNAAGKLGSR